MTSRALIFSSIVLACLKLFSASKYCGVRFAGIHYSILPCESLINNLPRFSDSSDGLALNRAFRRLDCIGKNLFKFFRLFEKVFNVTLCPWVSFIDQRRNNLNYFRMLPLNVPSFVFRHIFCCKIAETQSQSIKAKLPVRLSGTGYAPVTGKSAGSPPLREASFFYGHIKIYYGIDANTCGR